MNTFSANEIVQLALQIERDGRAFYEEAERLAKQAEAKELFRNLAAEEAAHADSFRQIAEAQEVSSAEYQDEEAYAYMHALIDGRIFASPKEAFGQALKGDHAALLRHAIGAEKETILFFQALRDVVREQDCALVDHIIAEEKYHVKCLSAALVIAS